MNQLELDGEFELEYFLSYIEKTLSQRVERLVEPGNGLRDNPAAVLLNICHNSKSRVSLDNLFIIFEKRSSNLKSHPGDMGLPGGSMDIGDIDLFSTAIRETEEEIGLPRHIPQFLGYMDDFVSVHGTIVKCVVSHSAFEVDDLETYLNGEFQPKSNESEAVAIIPISHLLDVRKYTSVLYDTDQRNGIYLRYFDISQYLDKTVIWGLTASMIRRFIDIIFPDNKLGYEPVYTEYHL